MKNTMIWVGIGWVLLSCQADSVTTKSTEKLLHYQETMSAQGGTLTFSDVEDSRCPENVTCIWAGNAIVDLEVRAVPGATEGNRVKLCLGDCTTLYPKSGFREADTAQITLNGGTHFVILKEVNPYPNTTRPVEKKEYTIKLEIQ